MVLPKPSRELEGKRHRGRQRKQWNNNVEEWTWKSFPETQAIAHNCQEWSTLVNSMSIKHPHVTESIDITSRLHMHFSISSPSESFAEIITNTLQYNMICDPLLKLLVIPLHHVIEY